MPTVTMVCLANSRKHGGRCVAGLIWEQHDHWSWIRPVSGHGTGELNQQRLYDDGTEPQLLDLIDLNLLQPTPLGCHAEDIQVDPAHPWHKRDKITYLEALDLVPTFATSLWTNGTSTSHGLNDSLDEWVAERLKSSLRLISPDRFVMTATTEYNRRKVRGEFRHKNASYKLSITDPSIEAEFAQYEVGIKRIALKPLLCISIGQVFERTRSCYKLIAGVIEA